MQLWNYDRAEVLEKLKELEFFSIVSRIPEPQGDGAPTQGQLIPEPEERETRYTVVGTPEKPCARWRTRSTHPAVSRSRWSRRP